MFSLSSENKFEKNKDDSICIAEWRVELHRKLKSTESDQAQGHPAKGYQAQVL
jgi:hypothetical protein